MSRHAQKWSDLLVQACEAVMDDAGSNNGILCAYHIERMVDTITRFVTLFKKYVTDVVSAHFHEDTAYSFTFPTVPLHRLMPHEQDRFLRLLPECKHRPLYRDLPWTTRDLRYRLYWASMDLRDAVEEVRRDHLPHIHCYTHGEVVSHMTKSLFLSFKRSIMFTIEEHALLTMRSRKIADEADTVPLWVGNPAPDV